MTDCKFCTLASKHWTRRHGDDIISFKPFGTVAEGHRMFVPVEHVSGAEERPDITARLFEEAAQWAADHPTDGFNLVVNSGAVADQTVFHLHVHYVPRSEGDGLGYRWRP